MFYSASAWTNYICGGQKVPQATQSLPTSMVWQLRLIIVKSEDDWRCPEQHHGHAGESWSVKIPRSLIPIIHRTTKRSFLNLIISHWIMPLSSSRSKSTGHIPILEIYNQLASSFLIVIDQVNLRTTKKFWLTATNTTVVIRKVVTLWTLWYIMYVLPFSNSSPSYRQSTLDYQHIQKPTNAKLNLIHVSPIVLRSKMIRSYNEVL